MQMSHLDTGCAEINSYHRTDYTRNRTLLMHMSNDLSFLQQQYHQMVQSANRTKICVLQDFDAISPFFIHKLNKITEYELWHQQLMHPGHSCMSTVEKCATGILVLSRHPMYNCKTCNEMNITKTTSKEKPLTPVRKFGDQFQMDFSFMSAKENNKLIKSHGGCN